MAIEDAVLLGRILALYPSVTEALLRYERARQDRATHMMLTSRRQGKYLRGNDPNRYLSNNPPFRDVGLLHYDWYRPHSDFRGT